MSSYRLTDNLRRLILGGTIHDDILNVRIILRQHTLYTTTDGLLTVVTACYNRNFHFLKKYNLEGWQWLSFLKVIANLNYLVL